MCNWRFSDGARKDLICSERGARVVQRRSGDSKRVMKRAQKVQIAITAERKAQGPQSQS